MSRTDLRRQFPKLSVSALAILAGTSFAVAESSRELSAHEHGVGALNIAIDGKKVAMEFHAPGADIVGFEYEASTAEDRAAIDGAVAILAKPLDLFVVPADAACSVTKASAALEIEDDHDEHDHDDHAAADEHDHDKHEDHAHDDHDDHDHEEHAHEDHDEHDHEEHAHEDHDDHDHEDHAEAEASHTEFHAEYMLTCANPDALTGIDFAYFTTFPNALELEVQLVSSSGAKAFEVERDSPSLDLRGMF